MSDQTRSKGVLVWLEAHDGVLTVPSQNLARLASDLAKQGELLAQGALLAACGCSPGPVALAGLGLSRVMIFDGPNGDSVMDQSAALLAAIGYFDPDIVLVRANERGREIAPMVAARLGTGLTADCTSLRIENGLLVQTRPAFGGDLIAEIVTRWTRPQMATVRASNRPTVKETEGPAPILIPGPAFPVPRGLETLSQTPVTNDDGLETAPVVIVAGLGLGGPEGVAKAAGLAKRLGAKLGATRAVVDQGWLPASRQIGLSGRNVSPSLMITLGVSGSVQFMAGAGGAGRILSVNCDNLAPILTQADVGLVMELENLWPELEERLGPLL